MSDHYEPEPQDADKQRGLYGKYRVERVEPSERHTDCKYFVLDLTHDPFARMAARAYADACKAEFPLLAFDLRRLIALATADSVVERMPKSITR